MCESPSSHPPSAVVYREKNDGLSLGEKGCVQMTKAESIVRRAPYFLLDMTVLISCVLFGYSFFVNQQIPGLPHHSHGHGMSHDGNDNTIHRVTRRRAEGVAAETPSQLQKWSRTPDDWESYTFSDVRDHFNCEAHSRDRTKTLPTLEDWLFLQKQYREHADGTVKFDDPVPPTYGYTLANNDGSPPYHARRFNGIGRAYGLIATRDIKKGELVRDGTRSDVVFPDDMAWRRFVFSLPRKMACDVTDWARTQKLTDEGRPKIVLGINVSSLMKAGAGPNTVPKSPTSLKMYASRDINKGEQIVTVSSVDASNWKEVGLE